jgi:DsbC/DsbD-like thiol-disulfide interchange protein
MRGRVIQAFVIALGALIASACSADEFSTGWAESAKSQARLVAAGEGLAGFEIRLAPGAITYWRDPGDAGAPPTFDFAGSDNVAGVDPIFPAPERIVESDGSVAFGYERDVILPLRIARRDPAKPVTLAVHANYAVCEEICLPARARLRLTLPSAPSPYAGPVEAALAAAPRRILPEEFGDLSPDGADGWRLCARREAGKKRDLFVESPEGWRIAAAPAAGDPSRDCFSLTLLEKPKDADLPVSLRLTMTGGEGPVETTMEAGLPK